MRKFTSTMISGLAVVVLATGLVGCRSTTSQLAGVPGFGWLDRSDDGWASYEPSPELPKPSATAEPTSGGAASKIASSDEPKSPFSKPVDGKPVEKLASRDAKAGNSRFDDRYLPSDSPDGAESKPTFGSYASAYGKYTPPKLNKGGKDVAAQDGPYSDAKQTDVASSNGPKFGGAINSPKFDSPKSDGPKFDASNVTGPKFDAALASKDVSTQPQSTANAPSFGPALNEQGTTGGKQPEFVADSSSRFGAGATKSYTPPGFPSTPDTKATTDRFSAANNRFGSTTSRFDSVPQPAMEQAASQYNRFAGEANRAVATGTNRFSNAVNAATQATNAAAQQTTDRFSNRVAAAADAASTAAGNRFENTVSAAQSALGDASQTARTTAKNTYNNAAAGLQNMASDYQQAASNAAANAASDISNRFQQAASSNMQSIAAAAEQAKNQVANTAQSYTQGLTNRFGAGSTGAAPGAPGSLTGAVQNTAQNLTQGVQSQVQSYAGEAVRNLEQGVASQYQQAKTTASEYANGAIDHAAQQANTMIGNATQSVAQPVADAAQGVMNQATSRFQQAAGTAQQFMQNVSNPGAGTPAQYPSTSTPNPFLNPPKASQFTPATNTTPSTNPGVVPSSPATNPTPTIRRDSTPFLPGSTKSFQSSVTVRKQEVQLASAEKPQREPLLLAVGDQYQFPVNLR